jgi:hypothetical protein
MGGENHPLGWRKVERDGVNCGCEGCVYIA